MSSYKPFRCVSDAKNYDTPNKYLLDLYMAQCINVNISCMEGTHKILMIIEILKSSNLQLVKINEVVTTRT